MSTKRKKPPLIEPHSSFTSAGQARNCLANYPETFNYRLVIPILGDGEAAQAFVKCIRDNAKGRHIRNEQLWVESCEADEKYTVPYCVINFVGSQREFIESILQKHPLVSAMLRPLAGFPYQEHIPIGSEGLATFYGPIMPKNVINLDFLKATHERLSEEARLIAPYLLRLKLT